MTPAEDIRSRTDRTLIRLSLEADERAQSEIVRRSRKRVENLIHMMVGNLQTAEDLAQEAFVNAFNALQDFQQEKKFAPWLLQIARNVAIDHLRLKSLKTVSIEGSSIWETRGRTPSH